MKATVFGAWASEAEQPADVWKESDGWASAPSGVDQGVRVEVVVLVPQVSGVVSTPPAPLKKCRSMSSIGSSGFSVKVAVSCPVVGSG